MENVALSPVFITVSMATTYVVSYVALVLLVYKVKKKQQHTDNRVANIELEREQELKYMTDPKKPLVYSWEDLYKNKGGNKWERR